MASVPSPWRIASSRVDFPCRSRSKCLSAVASISVGDRGDVGYRCPAGVITIGYGFTNSSQVCKAWFVTKFGRPLQMGDTITREDADKLLAALFNNEYGAAVTQKLGVKVQNQWDAATSTAFNCGTGALGWKWALALKRGDVSESSRLLRTTATTANGRTLAGLVRRR